MSQLVVFLPIELSGQFFRSILTSQSHLQRSQGLLSPHVMPATEPLGDVVMSWTSTDSQPVGPGQGGGKVVQLRNELKSMPAETLLTDLEFKIEIPAITSLALKSNLCLPWNKMRNMKRTNHIWSWTDGWMKQALRWEGPIKAIGHHPNSWGNWTFHSLGGEEIKRSATPIRQ